MSIIHVNQIRSHLEGAFGDLVDLSDVAQSSQETQQSLFLTRAQAAFVIRHLCDLDEATAAASITDGQDDNGIDAVYFDPAETTLYIAQSKWHKDGHGSVSIGDVKKFVSGFHDLINSRYDRFNEKLRTKKMSIESAMYNANTRIVMVLCYNGVEALSNEAVRDIDDLLQSINDTTEVLTVRVLGQADLHSIVAQGAQGAPINVEVVLHEWGQTTEPYRAYYGQVAATDLVEWYGRFAPRLFAPNIRMFLGSTNVNEGIIETLRVDPSNFWYFNNGITALCSSIRKKPQGGASRETGIFECSDVTVVNGAQTVGSIAMASRTLAPDHVGLARVPIRLISLEQCPPELGKEITRATNTQNRIDSRDFVALDHEQERIRGELLIDGIEYVYKSGDIVLNAERGFDLTEATIARACSEGEPGLAVQAKREISKLWDDITKAPYRRLFNAALTGRRLWRLVQMQRVIDRTLADLRNDPHDRLAKVAVHGNRLIAAQVFENIAAEELHKDDSDIRDVEASVVANTRAVAKEVQEEADEQFPDAYLQSLFKNAAKCADLHEALKARF